MRARWPRAWAALLLIAGAGAVGASGLLAGPAQAVSDAGCGSLQPCAPASGAVAASTTENGGTITITWTPVEPGDTINPGSAKVAWVAQANAPTNAPAPADTGPVTLQPPCSQGAAGVLTCTYDWPSDMVNQGYLLNGTYSVSATATECTLLVDCSKTSTAALPASIGVANPASAPTNVTAVIIPGTNPQAVQISWAPNPEPDVVGYQVFAGTGTTPVCEAATSASNPNTYSCTAVPPKNGQYSYHVVAYRYGATYSTKVADQVGSPASATTKTVAITSDIGTVTTTTLAGAGSILGPTFSAKPSARKATVGGSGVSGLSASPHGAVSPSGTTSTTDGGGFNATLPYGSVPQSAPPTTSDPAAIAVAKPHKASSVGTIAAIGAGLLIAVIAVHGLWLRSEVRRAGTLEPLEPDPRGRGWPRV